MLKTYFEGLSAPIELDVRTVAQKFRGYDLMEQSLATALVARENGFRRMYAGLTEGYELIPGLRETPLTVSDDAWDIAAILVKNQLSQYIVEIKVL